MTKPLRPRSVRRSAAPCPATRALVLCLVVFGLALLLGPPVAAVEKKKGKAFVPVGEVPEGLGVVYVFRNAAGDKVSRVILSVFANGRLVGTLMRGTYLPILVAPGEVTLDWLMTWPGTPRPADYLDISMEVEPGHDFDQRHRGVVLSVEPGGRYYVTKSGPFPRGKGRKYSLRLADAQEIAARLPKTTLPTRADAMGFYHYYQADVHVNLALRAQRAGDRRKVEAALRRAAKHYDSAASGFRLPPPKKSKVKGFLKELLAAAGPVLQEIQAEQIASASKDMAALRGEADMMDDAQRRVMARAIVDVQNRSQAGLAPAAEISAGPEILFDALASQMEGRSKVIEAMLTCFTAEGHPDLDQCATMGSAEEPY